MPQNKWLKTLEGLAKNEHISPQIIIIWTRSCINANGGICRTKCSIIISNNFYKLKITKKQTSFNFKQKLYRKKIGWYILPHIVYNKHFSPLFWASKRGVGRRRGAVFGGHKCFASKCFNNEKKTCSPIVPFKIKINFHPHILLGKSNPHILFFKNWYNMFNICLSLYLSYFSEIYPDIRAIPLLGSNVVFNPPPYVVCDNEVPPYIIPDPQFLPRVLYK